MDRRERILGDLDIQHLRGLEIGARHQPLVKKTDGPVLYVDYTSTEALRANWTKPAIIDPATFVDVDIVWGETALPTVDYIVASHVMEHVPDLAGWLLEMRQALKDGGVLCMALPDRRFTFDVLRAESTLAEVVEAHLLKARRPSIRQVFDSYALTRPNDHARAWATNPKAHLRPIPEKTPLAYQMAAELLDQPTYIDSHCWVFTPRSFLDLAEGMSALGWFPFCFETFQATAHGDFEFIVRLAAEDDTAVIRRSFDSAWSALSQAPVPPEESAGRGSAG